MPRLLMLVAVFALLVPLACDGHDGTPQTAQSAKPETPVAQTAAPAAVVTVKEAVPAAVQEAARQGLPVFLQKIPPGAEQRYGFDSRAQFDHATLGAPYQVYTLHPAEAQTMQPELQAVREWRFPIMAQGTSRALLTVAFLKGSWRAVDIGAGVLARDLEALRKESPATDRHILLRLYQARADFLLAVPADVPVEQGSLYPLTSAVRELKLDPGATKPYTLPGLLPAIRSRTARSLQQQETDR